MKHDVCPSCGNVHDPKAKFCGKCGVPFTGPKVPCGNCGTRLVKGTRICYCCGAKVMTVAAQPVAQSRENEKAPDSWFGILAALLSVIIVVTLVLLLIPTPVESVELSRGTLTLEIGAGELLGYEILPKEATDQSVQWHSSDPSVAVVDTGEVMAVGAGVCKITITTGNGKQAVCTVTVQDYVVEALKLDQTELNLHVGDMVELSCAVEPAEAQTELRWKSSDTKVVQVSGGKVTAMGVGTCTITVSSLNGVEATCSVTIQPSDEDEMICGDWKLKHIENRFEETVVDDQNGTIQLKEDQTGVMIRDGKYRAMRWSFTMVGNAGDYWYDLTLDGEENLEMCYDPDTDTVNLYWDDETWCFVKAQ